MLSHALEPGCHGITDCNALNIRYLDWITPSIWIIFVDEPVMSLLMSSKVSFIAKLSLFVHVDLCDGTVYQFSCVMELQIPR